MSELLKSLNGNQTNQVPLFKRFHNVPFFVLKFNLTNMRELTGSKAMHCRMCGKYFKKKSKSQNKSLSQNTCQKAPRVYGTPSSSLLFGGQQPALPSHLQAGNQHAHQPGPSSYLLLAASILLFPAICKQLLDQPYYQGAAPVPTAWWPATWSFSAPESSSTTNPTTLLQLLPSFLQPAAWIQVHLPHLLLPSLPTS